jgi:hypothetical protein
MKTKDETKSVPDIEPVEAKRWIGKPVNQYSLQGKYLNTFPSITAAAKELNIKGGALNKALKGILKSSHGYQWRYAE